MDDPATQAATIYWMRAQGIAAIPGCWREGQFYPPALDRTACCAGTGPVDPTHLQRYQHLLSLYGITDDSAVQAILSKMLPMVFRPPVTVERPQQAEQ